METFPYISSMKYRTKRGLRDHYREVARLAALGFRPGVIAKRLGLSPVTIGYILNNPEVRELVMDLQDGRNRTVIDLGARIDQIAPKALDYINQVIDGVVIDPVTGEIVDDPETGKPATHDASLRYKAAATLVSMAGYGPTKRISATIRHGLVSPDQIAILKERARQSGLITPSRMNTPVAVIESGNGVTEMEVVNGA